MSTEFGCGFNPKPNPKKTFPSETAAPAQDVTGSQMCGSFILQSVLDKILSLERGTIKRCGVAEKWRFGGSSISQTYR